MEIELENKTYNLRDPFLAFKFDYVITSECNQEINIGFTSELENGTALPPFIEIDELTGIYYILTQSSEDA